MSQHPKKSKKLSWGKKLENELYSRFNILMGKIQLLWKKLLANISYFIISYFAPDKDEFIADRAQKVIAKMKEGKLFTSEEEYIFRINEVLAEYNIPLEAFREFLNRPNITIYSVVSRKEWEMIFPKIVLFSFNKK